MTPSPMIQLRPFEDTDAPDLLALFRDTIRKINSADYDNTQINAWASDEIELSAWSKRFSGRIAYVAQIGTDIVGFSDMAHDGYLDRLFVSARHQRMGIASLLLYELKHHARRLGIGEIYTDASITARPFFEKAGFRVVREQTVESRGVRFINYRMVYRI